MADRTPEIVRKFEPHVRMLPKKTAARHPRSTRASQRHEAKDVSSGASRPSDHIQGT